MSDPSTVDWLMEQDRAYLAGLTPEQRAVFGVPDPDQERRRLYASAFGFKPELVDTGALRAGPGVTYREIEMPDGSTETLVTLGGDWPDKLREGPVPPSAQLPSLTPLAVEEMDAWRSWHLAEQARMERQAKKKDTQERMQSSSLDGCFDRMDAFREWLLQSREDREMEMRLSEAKRRAYRDWKLRRAGLDLT